MEDGTKFNGGGGITAISMDIWAVVVCVVKV